MTLQSKALAEDQKFTPFSIEERTLEQCEYLRCNFEGGDISEKSLLHCYFEHCTFRRVNMSNVLLQGSSFVDCIFEDCRLVGINWTVVKNRVASKVAFYRCNLSYLYAPQARLAGYSLVNCTLYEADFSEANCEKATFSESNLERATFHRTNIKGSDFRKAKNYLINPAENQVKGAIFSYAQAHRLLEPFKIVIDMD